MFGEKTIGFGFYANFPPNTEPPNDSHYGGVRGCGESSPNHPGVTSDNDKPACVPALWPCRPCPINTSLALPTTVLGHVLPLVPLPLGGGVMLVNLKGRVQTAWGSIRLPSHPLALQ